MNTAVDDAAFSVMDASEESNDAGGAGKGVEKPAIAKPQERLSWTTIDGKAKTSPCKGIRVTFVFDEPDFLSGEEGEVRQRLNEVIRSGNKALLLALSGTLYDAIS